MLRWSKAFHHHQRFECSFHSTDSPSDLLRCDVVIMRIIPFGGRVIGVGCSRHRLGCCFFATYAIISFSLTGRKTWKMAVGRRLISASLQVSARFLGAFFFILHHLLIDGSSLQEAIYSRTVNEKVQMFRGSVLPSRLGLNTRCLHLMFLKSV